MMHAMFSATQLQRRRQHLLWRIHRRYQTVTEQVHVGPVHFDFTRIADPNLVLDQVAEEEDRRDKLHGHRRPGSQLHLPYWAELWDSAWGIGQFLVNRAHSLLHPEASVLDLGCGMGFTGTAAARLGCRVLFADLEAPALLFARLNSLPDEPRVRTRRLNWQTDQLEERFHLILGADILYERAQWEYLEKFWRAHLAPGGQILLGEPGRQTGDLWMQWAQGGGWKIQRYEEPVVTRPKPIRLFVVSQ